MIILLAVLVTTMTIIMFITFMPFKYFLSFEKKDSINAKLYITFFKIWEYKFIYNGSKYENYFRILFLKYGDYKKNKPKGIYKNSKEESSDKHKSNDKKEHKSKFNKKSNKKKTKIKNKNKINKDFEKSLKSKKHKKSFLKGKGIENLKKLLEYPDKDIIIKYTIKFVKELSNNIKPNYVRINILAGFDNPAKTGYFLGLMSVISVFFPYKINTKTDFNNEIFNIDTCFNGKTSLWLIGFPILKYILKKPIWNLLMNREEN